MRVAILAPLERVDVGQEFDKFPPHVTIMPPAVLEDVMIEPLCDRLAEVADDCLPASFYAWDEDSFGDNGEITVLRSTFPTTLMEVHAGSLLAVEQLGGSFDRTYTGKDWHPHITEHAEISPRGAVPIDSMALFCAPKGGLKTVLRTFSGEEVA